MNGILDIQSNAIPSAQIILTTFQINRCPPFEPCMWQETGTFIKVKRELSQSLWEIYKMLKWKKMPRQGYFTFTLFTLSEIFETHRKTLRKHDG